MVTFRSLAVLVKIEVGIERLLPVSCRYGRLEVTLSARLAERGSRRFDP